MTKIRIYIYKRNFLIGWHILQLDINIRYVLMCGTFLADYFLFKVYVEYDIMLNCRKMKIN